MVDGQVDVDSLDAEPSHDARVGGVEEFVVVESAFVGHVADGFVLVCFDDHPADEEAVVFARLGEGIVGF